MKFIVIDPLQMSVAFLDVDGDMLTLQRKLFGPDKGVDHGVLRPRDLGYVVYEFGLYEPPYQIGYWRIGKRLGAGTAIVYRFDMAGETVDATIKDQREIATKIRWLPTVDVIEREIAAGFVTRPEVVRYEGGKREVLWSWPSQSREHLRA